MSTILALVQADKEGQIESKMIKARQMEEIREARRIEAEKKDAERKAKFDETKEGMRKKRKRPANKDDDKSDVNQIAVTGSRAAKPKKKVAFAE
jgi:60S ribosomal subunit assembly/export protein LOC1